MPDDEDREREQHIHVHVHFDEPVTVILANPPRPPATHAQLVLKEAPAMTTTTITVDTTNEIATLAFVDDHGDTDAAAPSGAIVTFTSDNPAVLTVASDPASPLVATLTPVAEGDANVGATITDAGGNPLLEADGVTPWAAIASAAVHVNPGAAVGARISVTP